MSKPKKEQRAWRLPAVFSVVLAIEFQSGSWNNFMSKTVTSRKVFFSSLVCWCSCARLTQIGGCSKALLSEAADWKSRLNWLQLARTECTQCSSPTRRGAGASRTTTTASTPPAIHKKRFKNSSTEGTVCRILLRFNGKISIVSLIDVRPWIK